MNTFSGYRPGVRGWWEFLRLGELLRDSDGIAWRVMLRRARPSARLRQSEQERAHWRALQR